MPWQQNYDPLNGPLSTIAAAIPIVILLGLLAVRKVPAYAAALSGLAVALAVAIGVIGMPAAMAGRAALLGAAYGFLPIGWIVLNVIFLYQLTEARGVFVALQRAITGISNDRRIQLLLIAFCFGAFFEGAAGFGTPVAVTGAMLIGLGLPALEASALSLIANTAPVAFGALGTPIIALQGVSGLDLNDLSGMVGRQLPFFSVIVPFWLIAAYAGFKGMMEIWPTLLVAGVSFAVPQFIVSNYHGPWLVDILAAACSMVCTAAYLKVKKQTPAPRREGVNALPREGDSLRIAVMPWVILSVIVFAWGTPQVKTFLNGVSAPTFAVPGLDKMVLRVAPVVAKPTAEPAVFLFNWLSASGTAILITAIIVGVVLHYSVTDMIKKYVTTLGLVWRSLVTISAMLALGYTTRYSGEDAILGLAFAHTGVLYPFFAAMLGWHGVAHTGSDTSTNVLFGILQRITAE
jgi:lactate permease